MTLLLIPTRNRPTALSNVLRYLARFHPLTRVIVADGSDENYKDFNRQNIEAIKRGPRVEYRPYPADYPYFDRLLDVVRKESSEFIFMSSDDDYPMMETLIMGRLFLEKHKDYSVALGMLVNLALNSPTELTAQLYPVRPIVSDEPAMRARQFAAWHFLFATTYGVTRREVMIERFERARKLFMVSFYDFAVGIHDCLRGKIKVMPRVGFICTRNYTHSYLRPADELIFLRCSQEVLQYADQFRRDFMQYGGLDEEEATKASTRLVKERVRVIVGRVKQMQATFENSSMFSHPTVQKQFDIFDALFEKDTPLRANYEEKLAFILSAMKANAASSDNQGERKKNETLEGQIEAQMAIPFPRQQ